MYLQEILEVAIGLVFMWMVMSIAAMQLQEWIATWLRWRSRDLEANVRNMLADPALAGRIYAHPLITGLSKKAGSLPSYIPADKFALALFDVITTAGTETSAVQRALYQLRSEISQQPDNVPDLILYYLKKWGAGFKSGWIKFVRFWFGADRMKTQGWTNKTDEEFMDDFCALLSNLPDDVEQLKGAITQIKNYLEEYKKIYPQATQTIAALEKILTELDQKVVPAASPEPQQPTKEAGGIGGFLGGLLGKAPSGADIDVAQKKLDEFNAKLDAFSANNPKLKQTMLTFMDDAMLRAESKEKAILLARQNMATWFDNSMERLSGWYKRKAQLMAFIIGLVIAVSLNVDSIKLANQLWREPTLRQALVARANDFVVNNPNGVQPTPEPNSTIAAAPGPITGTVKILQQELEGLSLPLGWLGVPVPISNTVTTQPFAACYPSGGEFTSASYAVFDRPANTSVQNPYGITFNQLCYPVINAPILGDYAGWLLKLGGLIMSGAAAAQGAPFWFDMLSKLINVRGAGRRPSDKKKEDETDK
jgi:hypothetical protein